jgi:hypothetical protein
MMSLKDWTCLALFVLVTKNALPKDYLMSWHKQNITSPDAKLSTKSWPQNMAGLMLQKK